HDDPCLLALPVGALPATHPQDCRTRQGGEYSRAVESRAIHSRFSLEPPCFKQVWALEYESAKREDEWSGRTMVRKNFVGQLQDGTTMKRAGAVPNCPS